MSDDVAKKTKEAITSHVRARLRAGYGMRELLDELLLEVTDTVNHEVMRQLESKETDHA